MAEPRAELRPVRESVPLERRPPGGGGGPGGGPGGAAHRLAHPEAPSSDVVEPHGAVGADADDPPLVAVAPAWVPPALAERWFLLRAGLTPGRVVGGGATLVVLAVAGWWLLRPSAPPVELGLPTIGAASSVVAPPVPSAAGDAATSQGATLQGAAGTVTPTTVAVPVVVQVAGAVAAPGVYRLPAGARVADLLDAAGGPLPEAAPHALALAQPLADGQRVVVPLAAEVVPTTFAPPPASGGGLPVPPAAGPGGGPGGGAVPAGPLDLNSATAEQLDTLPGIGPATAAAIVGHRERTGPFTSVDGLLEVRGIGPAKLDAVRALVTVHR